MATAAETEIKQQWAVAIGIATETAFPSITARAIFGKFVGAKPEVELLTVEPSVFPSESRSEEEIDREFNYTFVFATALSRETLKSRLGQMLRPHKTLTRVKLGQLSAAHKAVDEEEKSTVPVTPSNVEAHAVKAHGSMRVDLIKIEDLVNLIGELIINKNQVDSLSNTILNADSRNAQDTKQQIIDFHAAKNQLNYVTGKLRDLALGIRMVPVGQVVRKFPAAVREMARKCGKSVSVILDGVETELDKAILEEISDPLMHIIRNAVDHGIELPEERKRNGKSAEGTILIKAEHEGDRISVMVEDDGAGLNEERILKKAVEKGIIGAKFAERLTPKEIHQLIFAPGFSTAEKVSELSGRGVGMDVVKNNIARLNGVVEVESARGVGSRITLKLPLTLSILEGLLLEDARHVYAIPLIAIEKAYVVSTARLKRVGRYSLIEQNNQTIPVFRIAELFGYAKHATSDTYYLIEASSADGRFGLLVEKIVGRQEIVLKPLGDYLGKVVGISGSTILGDGRVALILDTKTIADSVSEILRTSDALPTGQVALGEIA